MVVLGVLAIMLAMAATAFRSGGKAEAVSSAAARVSTTISAARQLAISQNCRTRFVVLSDSTSNPEELRMHRYGVMRVPQDSPDTGETIEFEPAAQFEDLPSGVYFNKDKRDSDDAVTSGKSMFDSSNLESANLPGAKGGQYAYIEFLPTGAASRPSTENILTIEAAPSAKQFIADNKNYVRIGVAQYTGRVKTERPELKTK